LGVVVVRTALQVNLETAQIHAVSDPLQTILDGIPLDVRSISLSLDRPDFTLNPTSCEAKAVEGRGTTQAGQTSQLSNRFQVGECGRLKFKPRIAISLKGATGKTGHPALKAVVTYPKGGAYANIAEARVALPHSEFLDQGNLNKVCTQPQLRSKTCPAKAIYGRVKAWIPLFEKPLEGNVYLGVGYGYKLPALVAELDGQVRVLLKGKVDTTSRHGIRNTFETVPDAPQCAAPYSPSFCKKIGKSLKLKLEKSSASESSAVASPPGTTKSDLVSYDRPPAASASGASLKGSTKRGGHPALRAVLKMKPGEANIAKISVALPHSEFLAQSHIKTVCTRVQFAAGAGNGAECPKGSIYG